ncbi:hypothetical protein M409DRAFT_62233 [Zasmidium cellare ATCC 36951]|uniref:Major facilitator superfamily (MFS) profile domain-containing protein n=1 Tax=Zasmidium cellare ATCC 36951 TaxID=1080233 RepID=A0A6A6D3T2_ZASCE|nr:uncharacterized protein M409DRAFT_62233 [Zasmidium cellare ATCC 36951]KAF2174074.1 hypothetical protein M409DRAFT_62233 [Zasmidium cellare ATCC 36951]
MGIGVLDVKTTDHVPGTVHLEHVTESAAVDNILSPLKHGQGKDGRIILTPQPSDDPNDPLNWSFAKKRAIASIVYAGTVIHSATTAPLLLAGTVQIAQDLNISAASMVKLSSGYYLLAAGAACPFVAACSRKYGKRPIFVLSSFMAVIGSVVGATAQGYNSLLTARVIQGIASAAYETLVFSAIGDITFLHERGPRVAAGVFLLNAIANIVGIIAGTITTNLGWRYNFYMLIPFAALQAISTALFVPETSYIRRYDSEIEPKDGTSWSSLTRPEAKSASKRALDDCGEMSHDEHVVQTAVESTPRTWCQELRLYSGTYVSDPIWRILISFPVVLVNLGATFAVVSCGLTLCWLAATLILSSVLLTAPPYNLTSSQVGYASVAPAIGALLAGLFMGLCSDRCIRILTRRNRGIYEPEFQLPLTLIGVACAISGMVGLGYTYQQRTSLYVVCVCWGITAFGLSSCNTTFFNYALSAFHEYGSEILVMSALVRNFLGYGMSVFIVPWVEQDGPRTVLCSLGGIMAFPAVLVVVFYRYGKMYRLVWHRNNWLKKWYLESRPTAHV